MRMSRKQIRIKLHSIENELSFLMEDVEDLKIDRGTIVKFPYNHRASDISNGDLYDCVFKHNKVIVSYIEAIRNMLEGDKK